MGLLENIDSKLDKVIGLLEGSSTPAEAPAPAATDTKKKTTTKKKASSRRSPRKKATDLEAVKAAAREVLKIEGGKEKLIDLLEEYGVGKVVELEEEDYAEFVSQCKSVIEDAGNSEEEDFDI